MFRFKKRLPALCALVLLILLGQISHLLMHRPPQTIPELAWSPLPLWAEVPLRGQFRFLETAIFSPEGKYLALGGVDQNFAGWLRLWDVTGGREVGTIPWPAVNTWRLAFSPDGRTLACTPKEAVQLWDFVGQNASKGEKRFPRHATALALAPVSATLALGKGEGTIILWQPATGRELVLRRGHMHCVLDIAFSPDGNALASGSYDRSVRLWDVAAGKELATLWGHTAAVQTVAFSPDGHLVASGSEDRTVRLWEFPSGMERGTLRGHSDLVSSLAFSPDGRLLATAGRDPTVLLWDVATGKPRGSAPGHEGGVRSVAFTPDGRTLLTCDFAGIARFWDLTGLP
jgi:WD40 repeat protein